MRNAILASALLLATPLAGDQLRIATSNDWRQWQLPGDALIYNKNGKQVTQKQYNKLIPRWTSSSFLFLPTALRFSGLVRG